MKKPRKFQAAVLLTAVLAAVYCNCTLQPEEWVVTSDRLPEAFDGLKIVLLTDIHGGRFGPGNETLLKAVKEAEPDYIAIGGDLVDGHSDCSMLSPLLKGLTAIAPTCYVTGNHEWGMKDTEAVLKQIAGEGVAVLRNDYLLLEQNGEKLVLAGGEDPNGHADMEQPGDFMSRIREEVPGDPYTVLLYHRNDALSQWADLQTDLVLSGHGHGGVIRLPVIGGLLGTDRRLFPDYTEGLYTQGRTTMAVSRGLGGVRLWNRPHLPAIVLKKG